MKLHKIRGQEQRKPALGPPALPVSAACAQGSQNLPGHPIKTDKIFQNICITASNSFYHRWLNETFCYLIQRPPLVTAVAKKCALFKRAILE